MTRTTGYNRLHTRCRSAAVGEKESLTLCNTPQDAFRIFTKLQHGNLFHLFNFKFKFNKLQELKPRSACSGSPSVGVSSIWKPALTASASASLAGGCGRRGRLRRKTVPKGECFAMMHPSAAITNAEQQLQFRVFGSRGGRLSRSRAQIRTGHDGRGWLARSDHGVRVHTLSPRGCAA